VRTQVSDKVSSFLSKEMNKLLAATYRPGVDSREQPLYTIKEAAHYLGIKPATLKTWMFGRTYPTKSEGMKFWSPVISPADPDLGLLSFFNLAEAHILAATRYVHHVPFPAVRDAINNTLKETPSKHPLLSREFYTNGSHLFIKEIEQTIDVSRGQLSFKKIMNLFLERIVRDKADGTPRKVYPIKEGEPKDRVISIVSGVASGQPVIDGTGVPVSIVWRRHRAGETMSFISEDFGIPVRKIKRAIDYFERRAA
jgi:uncharacterized protein (DUF433 family)